MLRKWIIIGFYLLSAIEIYSIDIEMKISEYIENGQFSTAMKYLNDIDSDNTNIDVVVMKTNIFIDYFVQSMNHQIFGLTDLGKNETLEEFKKLGGPVDLYTFDPPEIISSLITIYPNNIKLINVLIKYYIDLYQKYGNTEKYNDPIHLAMDLSKQLKDKNDLDEENAAALGLIYLQQNNAENGKFYYKIALAKNSNNAEYNYNCAYAYIMTEDYFGAIPFVEIAYDLYENKDLKRDAYLMLGDLKLKTGKMNEAITIFDTIQENYEQNLFVERKIIQAYLLQQDEKKANETSIDYLLKIQAQENPIYKLANLFLEVGAHEEFIKYSSNSIIEYEKNSERNAMIYFYQAYILSQIGDKEREVEKLIKSKEELLKQDNQNGDLLNRINTILKEKMYNNSMNQILK